jgi:hypothetical protein
MNEELINDFWNELVGSQLSSVEFVQDYLQLRFDGPSINVTNPLTVKSREKEITSWGIGFRDSLCEQITKIVSRVHYKKAQKLIIHFVDETQIIISLLPEHYSSVEAIFAYGFKNDGWVAE